MQIMPTIKWFWEIQEQILLVYNRQFVFHL